MPAADNIKTVRDYFDVLTGKRRDRDIASFLAEDVIWTIPQSNPEIRPNPRIGKAAALDLLRSGVNIYRRGSLQLELENVFGDEQMVAAQFTLHAIMANGRDYHNQYVFLFRLRDGLITQIWEYLDTLYLKQRGASESR